MKKNRRRPDDEMRPEYDLSRMKIVRRGRDQIAPAGKTRITIRLDDDVLRWFWDRVEKAGGGNYQTDINRALREYIQSQEAEPLEVVLRRVIREELKRKAS